MTMILNLLEEKKEKCYIRAIPKGSSSTTAIPNKGFNGLRSSSPASSFEQVECYVFRNPLQSIFATGNEC